jgi:hypothetical protein
MKSLASVRRWLSGSAAKEDEVQPLPSPDPSGVSVPQVHEDVESRTEGLLEKANLYWHLGDWTALTRIEADYAKRSPGRAKVALLVGAAHLQTDNQAEAARWLQLAAKWGCDPQSISNVLIAGAHHNLARAAHLLGEGEQVIHHTGKSAALDWSRPPNPSIVSAKRQAVERDLPARAAPVDSTAPKGNSQLAAPGRKQEAASGSVNFKSELDKLKTELTKTIKSSAENTAKQLEAFLGIQNYLRTGDLIGEMHGWPVSPDLGLYLIRRVEQYDYDLVVEFGSGVSTFLIGKAVANVKRRTGLAVAHLAFEHLEEYHSLVVHEIVKAGLQETTRVILARLNSYTSPDGRNFNFYDCFRELETVAQMPLRQPPRVLVLVDGPPGSTGLHARFPALPVVAAYFPHSPIDVILDDYSRKEEREIVQQWTDHLQSQNLAFFISEIKLEKGACLVCISPSDDQSDGARATIPSASVQ